VLQVLDVSCHITLYGELSLYNHLFFAGKTFLMAFCFVEVCGAYKKVFQHSNATVNLSCVTGI
jgi:hypothetical protein